MPSIMREKKRRIAPQRGAEIGLGILLRDAYRAFTRALEHGLATHGVTHREWVHLWYIWEAHGQATPNYVSGRAGIKKASSTAALNSLEKQRLIQRAKDVKDNRRVKLLLTSAGNLKMKVLMQSAISVNRLARGRLSDQNMVTLFSALRTIAENLSSRREVVSKSNASDSRGIRNGTAKT